MSNSLSSLHYHAKAGRFGKGGAAGVILRDIPAMQAIQVSAWPERLQAVGALAAVMAGASSPAKPGQMLVGKQARLLRIEPLKWLVLSDSAETLTTLEIPADQGTALDVSHSRAWITLSGEEATTLLNNFLPLDLRDHAFPVGAIATTMFHHISATLWREEDRYHLQFPRGFAVSLWELLYDSALQYGLEVQVSC